MLDLDPSFPGLQVLCCLKGGKSSPAVIREFGAKVRQNDRLHAKVVWTSHGAVVGSANASSNGLVAEESSAIGLDEAGIFVDDERTLAEIQHWFDAQYKAARAVTEADLKDAAQARNRTPLVGESVELIDLPRKLLKQSKLAVMLWNASCSDEENEQVEALEGRPNFETLSWYITSSTLVSRYPYGYDCLLFRASRNREKLYRFDGMEHFEPQSEWQKTESGSVVWVTELGPEPNGAWKIGGLPPIVVGKRSEDEIRARVRAKKLRLKNDLININGGRLFRGSL
jgi:hypothetical protein